MQEGESGIIIHVHSMDACFVLTRKKNAGNSFTTPNHGCLIFADQDQVDNFVDNYSNSAKQKAVIDSCGHSFATILSDCELFSIQFLELPNL